jgi:hypothetical protein
MLGDELQQKVVELTYKGTGISVKTLLEILKKFADHCKEQEKYGKQSIKQLNRKGKNLDSIPVVDKDVKGVERELKKLGVDFAVRKSKSEENTYQIYFKAADVAQIKTALEDYMKRNMKQQDKPTIKEKMQDAVKEAKKRYESHSQQKEKSKERARDE